MAVSGSNGRMLHICKKSHAKINLSTYKKVPIILKRFLDVVCYSFGIKIGKTSSVLHNEHIMVKMLLFIYIPSRACKREVIFMI